MCMFLYLYMCVYVFVLLPVTNVETGYVGAQEKPATGSMMVSYVWGLFFFSLFFTTLQPRFE